MPPAILVIFGITGDLAQKKLLPAIYHLFADGYLTDRTIILGVSRRALSAGELMSAFESTLEPGSDSTALTAMRSSLRMHQMDPEAPDGYPGLRRLLDELDDNQAGPLPRLIYLSVPPRTIASITANLGQSLNTPRHAGFRLLVEKPFGYDLASAKQLTTEMSDYFDETQIYRIDHYLARETVQNILAFRAATPSIEQHWNRQHVTAIHINAYEQMGIEGRVVFYESVGALRDFVQSHLMQLLAIITMELPTNTDSASVHHAKLKLMRQIQPVSRPAVNQVTYRGQYASFCQEVGNPGSATETYAAVRLTIAGDRWRDVPMVLRSGKALDRKLTEVRIMLAGGGELVFSIQPDTGVRLEGPQNYPWDGLAVDVDAFNASHPAHSRSHPDAYERVLMDAISGDRTLFATAQEVLASWAALQSVIDVWTEQGQRGLSIYSNGASPPLDNLDKQPV